VYIILLEVSILFLILPVDFFPRFLYDEVDTNLEEANMGTAQTEKRPAQKDAFERGKPWLILFLVSMLLVVCYLIYQYNFGMEWSTSFYEDASLVDLLKEETSQCRELGESMNLPDNQLVLRIHQYRNRIPWDSFTDYLIQLDPQMLEDGREIAFPGPGIYAVRMVFTPEPGFLDCKQDFSGTIEVIEVTDDTVKARLTFEGIEKTFTFEK